MKKFIIPLLLLVLVVSYGLNPPDNIQAEPPPKHDSLTITVTHDRAVGDDMDSSVTQGIQTRVYRHNTADSMVGVKDSPGHFTGNITFDSTGSATDSTMSRVDTGYVKLLYKLYSVDRFGSKKELGQWNVAEFYDSTAAVWIDSVRWLTMAGIANTENYRVRFRDLGWCDFVAFTIWDNDSNNYTYKAQLEFNY